MTHAVAPAVGAVREPPVSGNYGDDARGRRPPQGRFVNRPRPAQRIRHTLRQIRGPADISTSTHAAAVAPSFHERPMTTGRNRVAASGVTGWNVTAMTHAPEVPP